MSDAEHDRVARLLREQGQAEAPPELAENVMAQVRREPQAAPARRGVNWRPVAAWAAVAAVLLAVGFGIATRAPGGSGSSSGSAAMEAAAGGSKASPARPTDSAADAYTVDRSAAEQILANHVPAQLSTGSASAARAITLSRAQWDEVRAALAKAAARDPHPENPVVVRLRPE
jgi:hypothetical protein